jgi:hypothetical protein
MNPGRRKRLLIAIGAVVVVAFVGVAVWPEPKEPEYQGKKLSEWVRYHGRYPFAYGVMTPQGEPPEVFCARDSGRDRAVRQFGTNCLPLFLRWVRYEKPTWKGKASISYRQWPRLVRLKSL